MRGRSVGMMPMWIMAMPHRMMKMRTAPVVVSCAAWLGEAEAVGLGGEVARVRALSHRAAQPEDEQNKREHRVAG